MEDSTRELAFSLISCKNSNMVITVKTTTDNAVLSVMLSDNKQNIRITNEPTNEKFS